MYLSKLFSLPKSRNQSLRSAIKNIDYLARPSTVDLSLSKFKPLGTSTFKYRRRFEKLVSWTTWSTIAHYPLLRMRVLECRTKTAREKNPLATRSSGTRAERKKTKKRGRKRRSIFIKVRWRKQRQDGSGRGRGSSPAKKCPIKAPGRGRSALRAAELTRALSVRVQTESSACVFRSSNLGPPVQIYYPAGRRQIAHHHHHQTGFPRILHSPIPTYVSPIGGCLKVGFSMSVRRASDVPREDRQKSPSH